MADSGSCTMATPPRRLISARPPAPQSSAPDKTMPTARVVQLRATERNSTSTDGRLPFSRGPRATRSRSSSTLVWNPGGAT
jgi:hypothetical protein